MKILVGVDVSQAGKETDSTDKLFDASQLNQLERLVGLKGADATLLFVQEELPSYEAILKTQADFPEDLGRQVESAARVKLDKLAEKFKAAGAQVKVEIVHGPPAYMIEQVSRDQGADLTVVTAGNRAGDRFLIGGTSQHIIRHSPCSVLVLRQEHAASGKSAAHSRGCGRVGALPAGRDTSHRQPRSQQIGSKHQALPHSDAQSACRFFYTAIIHHHDGRKFDDGRRSGAGQR